MCSAWSSTMSDIVPLRMAWRTRKSSSARAITSTMALPMPRTSVRGSGMKGSPVGRGAHYSRRSGNGNGPLRRATASWHGTPLDRRGPQMAFKERVFSGVQPTGNLHLGNYLGAIVRFVALQENYDCIYCVVDLHAITVWQGPRDLPHATREVTAASPASGMTPK